MLAKETDFSAKQFRRALDDPGSLGLPGYAEGNAEGYLFPATYAFRPNDEPVDCSRPWWTAGEQAADDADLAGRGEEARLHARAS